MLLQSKHWLQAIQHLPAAFCVKEVGEVIPVRATYNEELIQFSLDLNEEDLPPAIYDPMWHRSKEQTSEIGYRVSQLSSATQHDANLAFKSMLRIACQGGEFGVDPLHASNLALSRYWM